MKPSSSLVETPLSWAHCSAARRRPGSRATHGSATTVLLFGQRQFELLSHGRMAE